MRGLFEIYFNDAPVKGIGDGGSNGRLQLASVPAMYHLGGILRKDIIIYKGALTFS